MAPNASRTPTHQAAGIGTDWATEARRLTHADLGGAPWIADLTKRVAQADDDDLGTFIVARAALTKAASEYAAEQARQRSEQAASLARQRHEEAGRIQRENRRAEADRNRERQGANEQRGREESDGFGWELALYTYGWGLVASLVYSLWVATALQGCWGDFSLADHQNCYAATMDGTWELGLPILLSCLVPMGVAFALDVFGFVTGWMAPSWRFLFGIVGLVAGGIAYSTDPSVSPWLVGAGWILGQLIELATTVAMRLSGHTRRSG